MCACVCVRVVHQVRSACISLPVERPDFPFPPLPPFADGELSASFSSASMTSSADFFSSSGAAALAFPPPVPLPRKVPRPSVLLPQWHRVLTSARASRSPSSFNSAEGFERPDPKPASRYRQWRYRHTAVRRVSAALGLPWLLCALITAARRRLCWPKR